MFLCAIKAACVNAGARGGSRSVSLICMHMHADSGPALGIVRTGPLAFFVLSRQCLKSPVRGIDVETYKGWRNHICLICTATTCKVVSTH